MFHVVLDLINEKNSRTRSRKINAFLSKFLITESEGKPVELLFVLLLTLGGLRLFKG